GALRTAHLHLDLHHARLATEDCRDLVGEPVEHLGIGGAGAQRHAHCAILDPPVAEHAEAHDVALEAPVEHGAERFAHLVGREPLRHPPDSSRPVPERQRCPAGRRLGKLAAMDTLAELVRGRAHRPEPALIDDTTGAVVTAGELADRVAARGQLLIDAGVQPGDRVAVLLPNSLACAETLLATAAVGAAVVPINLRWTAPEVTWLLADAGPRVLVADAERLVTLGPLGPVPPVLAPELTQPSRRSPALPAPRPDDPALPPYTSGTTGPPNGAALTHRNLLWNAGRIAEWLALGPHDRFLMVMPLFHANALVLGLITPLLAGASAVVADRFRRERFWASVERHRP